MDTIETNAITQAAQLTLDYQLQLKDLLDTPLHNSIYMNVNNTLNGILNRLNHLSGQRPRTAEVVQFPPITDFMGEKMVLPRDLSTEDLEPKEHEKQTFIQRVDNLEAEFRSLSMFSLMNSYTNPDDVLVLRGVAKRAGVEGFEDRAITERFIDDITRGLEDKEKNAALNREIDQLTANVAAGDSNQVVNSIQTEFPPLPGFDTNEPVVARPVEEFTHLGETPLNRDEVVARLAANGMDMNEIMAEMVEWDKMYNADGSIITPEPPVGKTFQDVKDLIDSIPEEIKNQEFQPAPQKNKPGPKPKN